MDCTNCGNRLPDDVEQCPTCGTLVPQPVIVEGSGGRGWMIALAAFVLVGVGLGAVLLASGGESESEAAGPTVAEPSDDATLDLGPTDSESTTTSSASGEVAPAWPSAEVSGRLEEFTSPESDPAVGRRSPEVQGFDFAGSPASIVDDGRPKVIVFLAHWCSHCQREVPAVQAYVDSNGLPEGVDLIAVATSIDDERPNYPPDAWLEREGWSAPVVVDPDLAVAEAFGLTAFPYYVFLRDDFTVDLRITGELNPEPVFDYAAGLFGPAPEPTAAGPATYAEASAQPTACGGTAPPAPLDLTFDVPGAAPKSAVLTFTTSCGEIAVELAADAAPDTVESMLFLASEGYFDGTICHRLVPGFVLQCGDPSGTGRGGPGYVLSDEFPNSGDVYTAGAVAMANAGPGTTGSQFFVVIGDATGLPPQFTYIGRVADPAALIEALSTVPLGLSLSGEVSAPLETIYIETSTIGE